MSLVDGRHLHLVRATSGVKCLIPSAQTIDELLSDVRLHHELHPDHPYDCACLEFFIQRIKAAVYRQMVGGCLSDDLKGKYRFRHVLHEAMRSV
jgi:hypothetical protein